MLKKAGIITVGVAASLVAVSPLAFATEKGGEYGGGPKNVVTDVDSATASGLIAVGGINALNDSPINVQAPVNVNALLGLLGSATQDDATGGSAGSVLGGGIDQD